MRLFTALDLTPEILRNIEAFLVRVRPAAKISWSPAANLHITTKFIGEWAEGKLDALMEGLRAMPSREPFEVRIRQVGFFPTPRSPRNFWCGVEAKGLAELAADTDRATAALGIPSEKRAYSPHLTLARIKERLNLQPLHDAIAAAPSLEFGGFRSESFFLYRSQLRPTGSVYTKLAEFPFAQ